MFPALSAKALYGLRLRICRKLLTGSCRHADGFACLSLLVQAFL